jgi:hypothetical protein
MGLQIKEGAPSSTLQCSMFNVGCSMFISPLPSSSPSPDLRPPTSDLRPPTSVF